MAVCPAAVVAAAFIVFAVAAPAARATEHGKDWQHCLQVVANLRESRDRSTPVVVLLGGSSARECTVSDAAWSRQIRRRSGIDVSAYNVGSKHRTFSEDLDFVKLLPRRRDMLVYIGVNLGRFCLGVSPAAIRLPRAEPLPEHRRQHVYSSDRIHSAAAKHSYVSYWMECRYPNFVDNYESELAVLGRILRVCKRRGIHVALVDLPRDLPAIGSLLATPVGRYHAGCAKLAARYDVPWLTFCAACDFEDSDFYDLFHLVEPGRVKYQSVLSDKTIRLLERYGITGTERSTASASPSASPSASAAATGASAEGDSLSTTRGLAISTTAVALLAVGVAVVGRRRAA